ncbi:methyl-accepting chemotaxis protein [Pseudobacillus wudalianchiensis]|uniref:methyl-accepting chemotaxis protein n=1 Tax=Pseudobacillus wudalianchiensis TaxID=1743143 RepID=UPI00098152E9|nr:HAMP domain-containing methyl-accepting chemotaxis protein [Bacillus wudalianchiensis]
MKRRRTLVGKNLFLSFAIVVLVGLCTGVISYAINNYIVKMVIHDRAGGIANLWASTIDVSDIERAKNNSDVDSKIQQKLIKHLDHLAENESSVSQGYIMDSKFADEKKGIKLLAVPTNNIEDELYPGDTFSSELLAEALEKAVSSKQTAYSEIYTDEFGTWQAALVPILNEHNEVTAVFGVDLDASIMNHLKYQFLLWLSISIVICLIIVLILQYFGTKKLLSPIKDIQTAISKVSNGDLTTTINVKSKDELGELSHQFNEMTETLSSLIKEARLVTDKVYQSSTEFLQIAGDTVQSANQFSLSIHQVTESLEHQTVSSIESARVMEEMATGIQQAAESASTIAMKSEDTLSQTQNGKNLIQQAVNQMQNINQTVGSSAEVVTKLGTRSQEIGQIVSVISEITEQTNLLALNAAIEAARAGEAGRGFAVVADEVRNLAEQSKVAAAKIVNIIQLTQDDTKRAVEAMTKGTMEAATGVQVIDDVGNVINEIVESTKLVSEEIQESSAVFEEMSASSEEVNATVDEIAHAAQSSLTIFEELSSQTDKQLQSMKIMEESSQTIAKMVKNLERKLNTFTIKTS